MGRRKLIVRPDLSTRSRAIRIFRVQGLRYCRYIIGIGIFLIVCFLLFDSLSRRYSYQAQALRLGMLGVLLLAWAFVFWKPRLVIRYYDLIIGGFFCSFLAFLVALIMWPATGSVGDGFDVMPVTMFCLLALYGFLRLPVGSSVVIGLVFSFLMAMSLEESGDGGGLERMLLYLVATNLIGVRLALSVQRREIELILLRKRLRENLADLSVKISIAEAADRDRNRLISAINHDLKQPLVACGVRIGVLSSALERGVLSDARANIREVVRAFTLLGDMLEHLLGVARSSYSACVVPVSTNIGDVFAALSSAFFEEIRDGRLVLAENSGVSGIMLRTDYVALVRILNNIIGNGLKACRNKSGGAVSVKVRVAYKSERIIFHVVDRGVGLSLEHLGRVWLPGFKKTTEGSDGSGMGLFWVRELLAEMPRHHIVFASREGRGSRVSVIVPVESYEQADTNHTVSPVVTKNLSFIGLVSVSLQSVSKLVVLLEVAGFDVIVFSTIDHAFFEFSHMDRTPEVLLVDAMVLQGSGDLGDDLVLSMLKRGDISAVVFFRSCEHVLVVEILSERGRNDCNVLYEDFPRMLENLCLRA